MLRERFEQEISCFYGDIAYLGNSDAQKMDLYLPKASERPYPLIVVIHGGAFRFGDKDSWDGVAPLHGLARGYAVASVNYRLSAEALFPANVLDVRAAIRFLRANAARFGLDAGRFCVWGPSAGGYLSAMAGVAASADAFVHEEGDTPVSCAVQAAVDWFGPIDFDKMDGQFAARHAPGDIHNAPDSPESLLLGDDITHRPDLVARANPETYITPDAPPFLIQHGSDDLILPFEQSVHFADCLRKANVPVELDILPGAGHGGPQFDAQENVARVFAFLDRHLHVERR